MRSGRRRAPWFAFLVHPRDEQDMLRSAGGRLLWDHSRSAAEFRDKFRCGPPAVVGELHFGFQSAWGELVSVQRCAEDLVPADRQGAVVAGLRVAAQRGARVVGLGALTSPATGGGLRLLPLLPPGVTLTNGNAYTAAVVCHNVVEAVERLGAGRRARVAVVGCTGSVGVAASRLLAERGFRLLLIGRTARRVASLLGDLAPPAELGSGPSRLATADVVVLLTNDTAARPDPQGVQPGCMVIDCAQPAGVDPDDLAAFAARGVAVAEGGLVSIPGFVSDFDLRLPAGAAFACLAETYLFAREGIREHSAGRPPVELARRLERLAERHGVGPHPLHLRRDEPAAAEAPPRIVAGDAA